jgi:hypothetical protein
MIKNINIPFHQILPLGTFTVNNALLYYLSQMKYSCLGRENMA